MVRPAKLIKILESNGWILDRTRGSHKQMIKAGERTIPIAFHGNDDVPPFLVKKILKQAGIKENP